MVEYLDDYVIEKMGKKVGSNAFNILTNEEIIQAEKVIGSPFPAELKKFYNEIGCGTLQAPYEYGSDYKFYNSNEILPPTVVAGFYHLAEEHHKKPENERTSLDVLLNLDKFYNVIENHSISVGALELLEPGDLPIFEMYDSSHFLIMKLNSDNPNAVWSQGLRPIKIEDSFEKFIWRLYYENPWFYDDIIEAYYKNKSV